MIFALALDLSSMQESASKDAQSPSFTPFFLSLHFLRDQNVWIFCSNYPALLCGCHQESPGVRRQALPHYLAGVVSFQGFDDNLNYHQFVKAGTVNGRFMWTRRLVGDKFKGPPTKTFEEATEFYKETIDAVKGAYEFFLQNIWTNKASGARDTCCLFNSPPPPKYHKSK